jgi:hypothetical protein
MGGSRPYDMQNRLTEMSKLATAVNVVLGIFNAYMLLRSRRVSLMVVPTIPQAGSARGGDRDSYEIRVQVVNLSNFPIYLSEAGLQRRSDQGTFLKFEAPEDRPYPILLQPRESVRLLPSTGAIMRSVAYRYSCAYARTECGRTRRGTSPTLQQQEINVLESEKTSQMTLTAIRLRHLCEGFASRVGAVFW